MSQPTELPITITQGATCTIRLRVLSGGVPVDLTEPGWRVEWQARTAPGADGAPLLALDSQASTFVLGADGWAVGTLSASATGGLTAPRAANARAKEIGYHDARVTAPGGVVSRPLRGALYLVPGVTRDE